MDCLTNFSKFSKQDILLHETCSWSPLVGQWEVRFNICPRCTAAFERTCHSFVLPRSPCSGTIRPEGSSAPRSRWRRTHTALKGGLQKKRVCVSGKKAFQRQGQCIQTNLLGGVIFSPLLNHRWSVAHQQAWKQRGVSQGQFGTSVTSQGASDLHLLNSWSAL